jgi:hypothetical protein
MSALAFDPWEGVAKAPRPKTPAPAARIAPIDRPFVTDPLERAAIQAEPMPVQSLRKRPVSWARAADEPAPGDVCGCCASRLWWTETDAPKGWRCACCHPPAHLQPGQFRAVAT